MLLPTFFKIKIISHYSTNQFLFSNKKHISMLRHLISFLKTFVPLQAPPLVDSFFYRFVGSTVTYLHFASPEFIDIEILMTSQLGTWSECV